MAANEYVQAAAGQLQSAATAVKSDIDQLRANFKAYERQVIHDIDSIEREMRANLAQAATSDNPSSVAYLSGQAAMQKGQIEDLKKQLDQRRAEVDNQIRSKEDAMTGLMSQSKGLQDQAANLR